MDRPVFSPRLDADPAVKRWLDGLDARTKRALRDDVTPLFKEVAHDAEHFERLPDAPVEPEAPRMSDEVLDAMKETAQSELFPELGEDLRGAIMKAARENLPDWQYRAFVAWFRGTNRNRIARNLLGVSRSAVRSALDGEGHRGGPGAIQAFTAAIVQDEGLRKVVMQVATKQIGKRETEARERVLQWWQGIDNKPAMVVPLAMLMVIDALADARGEVNVADIIPHFPRSTISQCMTLLRAHGFAASNGHKVKIHRTPCSKFKENP